MSNITAGYKGGLMNQIQTLEKERLELLEKIANIENRIYELKSEVK